MRMEGFSDANTQLQVMAGAGRNASIQFGSNGVDNVFNIGSNAPNVGHIWVGSWESEMRFTGLNGNKGMAVGINAGSRSSAVLDVDLKGTWSNQVGLRVRQQSGGTGNLFQAEDSAGAVRSGFDRSGYVFTRLNTAPDAANLAAGQAAFWFDPTAGAARMMVTAKDTGGALVTGSLAASARLGPDPSRNLADPRLRPRRRRQRHLTRIGRR
jgi:hypothetical protein